MELDSLKIPKKIQSKLKQDIGEFLKEQILLKVADAVSPVTGDAFDRLSKEYKAKKSAEGYSTTPNLEVTGDMLGALDYQITSDGIEIGVYGDQAPKADGHNNFSGKSQLPERRFIPDEGQEFSPDIMQDVDNIIADTVAENTQLKLDGIGSKVELFDYLQTVFVGYTDEEIAIIIQRNPDLLDELGDMAEWLN